MEKEGLERERKRRGTWIGDQRRRRRNGDEREIEEKRIEMDIFWKQRGLLGHRGTLKKTALQV